jgi:hypothetical protein
MRKGWGRACLAFICVTGRDLERIVKGVGDTGQDVGQAALIGVVMNDYVALLLGVVCAGVVGEAFIRGAVGIARSTRVSPAIIGATVACTFPVGSGLIRRRRGVLLLVLYGLYLAIILQRQ